MTHAVDVYELLSERIEHGLAPRKTLEQPERAFGRIGIAAVAGALAASRPDERDRRLRVELPAERLVASTWR